MKLCKRREYPHCYFRAGVSCIRLSSLYPINRFELLGEVFSVGPSLGQICLRFVFYRYFDDFAHDGYAAKDPYGGRQAQPSRLFIGL